MKNKLYKSKGDGKIQYFTNLVEIKTISNKGLEDEFVFWKISRDSNTNYATSITPDLENKMPGL